MTLPGQIYLILKLYVTDEYFRILINKIKLTTQGSVLGFYRYLVYAEDIPTATCAGHYISQRHDKF